MPSTNEIGGINVDAATDAYNMAHPKESVDHNLEMIRRGLSSEFWLWLAAKLKYDIELDVLQLTDPACELDIQFLRGRIRAKNEILRLPTQLVESYDVEKELDREDNPQLDEPDNPASRRASPIPEGTD